MRVKPGFMLHYSPLLLSDMISGYNVATTIYLLPRFNALCGLEQHELATLTEQVLTAGGHDSPQQAALKTMKQFYNGYRFCDSIDKPLLYNPTLCFYFLSHYQHECEPPRQRLDGNLAMNDRYYIMDSETALARRYSDLVMITHPGMRKYPALHDFIFEFKYLKLAELGITGEQVRNTQRETLLQLAPVQTALSQATG